MITIFITWEEKNYKMLTAAIFFEKTDTILLFLDPLGN